MNLFNRLSIALKMARNLPQTSLRDPRLAQLVRVIADHNAPHWPRLDVYSAQADEYARSAWVYVAVTRIAESAALVPVNAFRLDGEKRIGVPNHPIEQLLRAPNPTMS